MCGLLDLIWALGHRIRQHSICKRTWPMPTFLRPSYWDLSFHLMQVLGFIWSSTWSWCKCYFERVPNILFWAKSRRGHLIHAKAKKTVSCEVACVDVVIFIWCLALNTANCSLILLDSKVQRENGFSIWHSFLLDCIPLVRSFQLLTFNFMLRIILFISSHFLNFKIPPPFKTTFFACDFKT